MTGTEKTGLAVGAAIFLAAAFVPLLSGGYGLSLAVTVVMYAVLTTSWTLFSGPTHYISLATAAFFGLGMYTVAALIDVFPYPVLLVMATVVGAVLAALIGLATLRLSGVYFVIFTLGLAEMVRQLVTWVQTTMGTSSGLVVLTGIDEPMIYWQLLALAAAVYLASWRIGRSRLGFALRIIGGDEVVARHSGINTAHAKIALFVISGSVAALTGAILAPRWTYVEPVIAFSPMLSFLVVIMALLGGVHRLWGPLLGVIPFTFLWDLVTATFPNQTALMLGLCFLLIVYIIPNGFAGLIENLIRRRPLLAH